MEATERRYHLTCKINIRECSIEDVQSTKTDRITEKLVFLTPVQSSQADEFYFAWLPDTSSEHYEIVMKAGRPVYGFIKGCVRRAHRFFPEPHIFVMSPGAEEDMKKMGDGKELDIEVLGEDEEHMGDHAKDMEITNRKKFY